MYNPIPVLSKKNKVKIRKIVRDYNSASKKEVWGGALDNFLFGFLSAC